MKKKNKNIEKPKNYKYYIKSQHTDEENEKHDKEMIEKHRHEMKELSVKKKIKGNIKYLEMFEEISKVAEFEYNKDELEKQKHLKPNSYIKLLFEKLYEIAEIKYEKKKYIVIL